MNSEQNTIKLSQQNGDTLRRMQLWTAAPVRWFQHALTRVRWVDAIFLALPCVVMLLVAACVYACNADVHLSSMFYEADNQHWPLADTEPFATMYSQGCMPSMMLGIFGLMMFIAGWVSQRAKPYRRAGLFLAVTLALGPGLLVNGLLKPYVGRPRPIQTEAFGGNHQFAQFGLGNAASDAFKSFPSGHASMGFFLMTPALLYYRSRPRLAMATILFGGGYGLLMGVARMAQGAHFATDVLAAAVLVYLTSGVVYIAMRLASPSERLGPAQHEDVEPGPVLLKFPQVEHTHDDLEQTDRKAA